MTNTSDIPAIISIANIPFVLRYPATVYWSGVLIPSTGMVLESLGIAHAFVASGVVLGFVVLALSMAARHCSQIAQFANEKARDAARKRVENNQAAMNARNLMRQAKDAGDLVLLTKLVEIADRCDASDWEFEEAESGARDAESKYSHYDNELSKTAWAFGIIAGLVSGLGGFLNIPSL